MLAINADNCCRQPAFSWNWSRVEPVPGELVTAESAGQDCTGSLQSALQPISLTQDKAQAQSCSYSRNTPNLGEAQTHQLHVLPTIQPLNTCYNAADTALSNPSFPSDTCWTMPSADKVHRCCLHLTLQIRREHAVVHESARSVDHGPVRLALYT